MSDAPLTNDDRFAPGSWSEVRKQTGWYPGKSSVYDCESKPRPSDSANDFLRQMIRHNEELKKLAEQADAIRRLRGLRK